MHPPSTMQFLTNSEINRESWDACITNSTNDLIYAKAFYLDNLAPGWSALAGENFEWVMPLTAKTKFSIAYLYQPVFVQQLGIFAKANVTVPYQQVVKYLQQQYKFWEINWNPSVSPNLAAPNLQVGTATNFILNLSCGYERIEANYHTDLIKNLKRSKRFRPVYKTTEAYHTYIQLYRKHYGERIPHVKENDYQQFGSICAYAKQNEMLVCREAVTEQGELLAVALLLFDGKRLYNLMNTTTEAGRKTAANHFLLDSIIKEFAGQAVIFDFEGSDLPGVKEFYENFGAENERFYTLKYNNLPWPLRTFKR